MFSDFLKGIITIADPIKPEAKLTVSVLKKMGIKCWMITGKRKKVFRFFLNIFSGDSQAVASRVADELELTNFMSQVKPADKSEKVNLSKKSKKPFPLLFF